MSDELNSVSSEEVSADTAEVSDATDQLAGLLAERDSLASQVADLNDRLLRRSAEFDNFRKRAERERQDLLEYGATDALTAMLPVLDDFERALAVETADKEYARGMELIYQRMFDALRKLGLEPLEAAGKMFDPYVHHAVEMVPTNDVEDQTVLADLQRGYNFRGRQLRPSMVKVAVKA